MEDNYPVGDTKQVAYLHRTGGKEQEWDISGYIKNTGKASTYDGQCIVGGIVNDKKAIDLYYFDTTAKKWQSFDYTAQKRLK